MDERIPTQAKPACVGHPDCRCTGEKVFSASLDDAAPIGQTAGLVLYALQTASSNLANGADFSQTNGATVAGMKDSRRISNSMTTCPIWKAEEADEEGEQNAEIAQIEEQAAAYAKLDAAGGRG